MQPTPISEEAPAASLVGSLSVFTLADVLSLLAATDQTGELQVVNDLVDGRIWLEDGQFSNAHVGAASTIGQAVFELLPCGRVPNPKIACARRTKRVAEAANHVAHGAEAFYIRRSKGAHLSLAKLIVIP